MTTSCTLSAITTSASRTTGRPAAAADGFRGVWARVCSAAASLTHGPRAKRLAATLVRSLAVSVA